MKYTRLAQSDLNVSRICMGCMGFGDAAQGQHTRALRPLFWRFLTVR